MIIEKIQSEADSYQTVVKVKINWVPPPFVTYATRIKSPYGQAEGEFN